MGIVIRPTPAVFRRSMPLVIVFGAYRRFDIDPPLPSGDFETITRVVGMARRLRMPLAFIRNVPQDRGHEPGSWLPGCRPKTTDRVFDHPAGAPFHLDGFANAFNGLSDGELYATGPSDDSCLSAAIAAPQGEIGPILHILPYLPLHKCSTPHPLAETPHSPPHQSNVATAIPLQSWERAVCQIQ